VSLLAHAALWIALGFALKAGLVLATGNPAPPTNLGWWLRPESGPARALVALTNPFLVAAAVWTVRGLRAGDTGRAAAWTGVLPWMATAAWFALAGGGASRMAAPVPVDDWQLATEGTITLRYPPGLTDAGALAGELDVFSARLGERFGFEPRPVRIHVYPDHATLEDAIAERLHVRVTGSIRGSDLLYLEMPGSSAAVPRVRGLRDALRWVAIMQLAPVMPGAPRWFVEGVAHAAAVPGDAALDRDFRDLVRRVGVPEYRVLLSPTVFSTPEGPLLARSLVDHIASAHGPATLVDLARDLVTGGDFRDALFERTRWTTGELESGWRATLERVFLEEGGRLPTPPDTTGAPTPEAGAP
ncbi:MAG TPA: hypothetical protein VKU85_15140, partial [bacterium]|nr:hypothetical protein [bacterium]